MNPKDGGQAFPVPAGHFSDGVTWEPTEGMTLRDYFAGQFLAAVTIRGNVEAEIVARDCYEMADAMLKERAK